MNTLRSFTETVVTTPTDTFPISFEYDEKYDAVHVFLNEVAVEDLGYTVSQVNAITLKVEPAIPEGTVRIERETDIDKMKYIFDAGALFIDQNVDADFRQIVHSQQEVRDGFIKLRGDVLPLVHGLQEALQQAQEASEAAQEAANAAEVAAAQTLYYLRYYSPDVVYPLNARIMLDNGDIVKSTIPNNVNNPNSDMTGWINPKQQQDKINSLTINKILRANVDLIDGVDGFTLETIDTQQRFYFDSSRISENNGGTVLNGWIQLPKVLKASWWKLPKASGNCFAEISAMVAVAKPLGLKIEFDVAGLYDLGANHFPVRKLSVSDGLEDYNGLTIECVQGVVFKTTATTGQDVFQLNSVKNFHILGFPKITSSITSSTGAGSNGVSITNGGENLTIHVDAENLPYTVKSNYIDGGKAVSIQNGSATTNPTRNIDVHLRNCNNVGYGFNMDVTTSQIQNNPITNIKARGFVENAYRGVSVALDQTGSSIGTQGLNIGVDIDFVTKNCQQHYTEQRTWNLKSKIYAINTLAANAIRKADITFDTVVYVDSILGKKYGSAEITGSVLDVDVVHRVGGTGSNGGKTGACSFSNIELKVNYTTATTPFDLINSGGNIVNNCSLVIENIATLPALLFNSVNTVLSDGTLKTKDLVVVNTFKVLDTITGAKRFGVRSDGHLEVPLTSGAVGTTSAGKMAVYNRDGGAFIGYIPIYTA